MTFTERVYELVAKIPAGKVLTYSDVATLCGSSGAARAVGTAMKHNPDKSVVPCHRVVGSDGLMHGYAFGGMGVKIQILKQEGVKFDGDKVNLEQSRWEYSLV